MNIIREGNRARGAYRARVEGTNVLAELSWHGDDAVRVADHTFTPPEARGKGIALAMVEALVADAREQGFKVVPSCSYVAAQFRRHPEWAALLG